MTTGCPRAERRGQVKLSQKKKKTPVTESWGNRLESYSITSSHHLEQQTKGIVVKTPLDNICLLEIWPFCLTALGRITSLDKRKESPLIFSRLLERHISHQRSWERIASHCQEPLLRDLHVTNEINSPKENIGAFTAKPRHLLHL